MLNLPGVDVGGAILALAAAGRRRSIVVVGTGKNVGKTTVVESLLRAAERGGAPFAATSIGRDGEPADALGARPKPRLFFRPGAVLATAVDLLRGRPGVEYLELVPAGGPLGPVAVVRVATAGFYELAGPHTARGMRRLIAGLDALGRAPVIVDGAIDRMAALAGGHDAVVIATGLARGGSVARIVADLAALVQRLQTPPADPARPAVPVEGVLTEALAAQFIRSGERRQIVVADPTRIALAARSLAHARERLDLRCARPLHVIACALSAAAADRSTDPAAFVRAAARATGLPAFDVYAAAAG